jgi:hypothetical protein
VAKYNALFALKKLPMLWLHLGQLRHVDRLVWTINQQNLAATAIAVDLSGAGLGDLLVVARYLRDLTANCPHLALDVYCHDVEMARWAFGGVPGLRHRLSAFAFDSMKHIYPLALRIGQCIVIEETTIDEAAISANLKLKQLVRSLRTYRRQHEIAIAHQPSLDGYIAQRAVYSNNTRASYLQTISGFAYAGDRLRLETDKGVLERNGLTGAAYVTIHDGFSPTFVVSSRRATKCYPHFDAVFRLLKARFPDLKIVQLGAANGARLAGCDLDLRGATTLPEAASVLAGSILHIDNEGGLVHLAACLGVKSCVIFGPTPADYFGYPDNINIRPNVCGGCWWTNDSWMDQCPRGFAIPICMSEQPPDLVAARIEHELACHPSLQSGADDGLRKGVSCPQSASQTTKVAPIAPLHDRGLSLSRRPPTVSR